MVNMRYAIPKIPMTTRRMMATTLNRNTERWRSVGAISTAWCMAYFRVPRNKNERTRARSLCTLGICGSWRYLRAHCCVRVASRADVVLSTRLSSHTTLTQITETLGGDDGYCCGWMKVPFAKPESCRDTCPRRNTVWSPESRDSFL